MGLGETWVGIEATWWTINMDILWITWGYNMNQHGEYGCVSDKGAYLLTLLFGIWWPVDSNTDDLTWPKRILGIPGDSATVWDIFVACINYGYRMSIANLENWPSTQAAKMEIQTNLQKADVQNPCLDRSTRWGPSSLLDCGQLGTSKRIRPKITDKCGSKPLRNTIWPGE